MESAATYDDALLEAARAGDDDAYARLVGAHRGELHAHCYRMLGSVQDAEDAMQEALIRAWRALPRFERRSSLRSWLYRIATNTCLDAIGKRPKRVLPIDYGPPADPSPTRTSRSAWPTGAPPPTPATSCARASSWRSSPRCSCSRRASAPC